jgi:hypothetical protein
MTKLIVPTKVLKIPMPGGEEGLKLFTPAVGRAFVIAAAKIILQRRRDMISKSRFYSVSIDESDNRSKQSTMAIIFTYLNYDGNPTTSYTGLMRVMDRSADGLRAVLVKKIKELGLDLAAGRLVGLGTDGASVMTGSSNGVTTQMEKLAAFLVAIHCIAHREALACKDVMGVELADEVSKSHIGKRFWLLLQRSLKRRQKRKLSCKLPCELPICLLPSWLLLPLR